MTEKKELLRPILRRLTRDIEIERRSLEGKVEKAREENSISKEKLRSISEKIPNLCTAKINELARLQEVQSQEDLTNLKEDIKKQLPSISSQREQVRMAKEEVDGLSKILSKLSEEIDSLSLSKSQLQLLQYKQNSEVASRKNELQDKEDDAHYLKKKINDLHLKKHSLTDQIDSVNREIKRLKDVDQHLVREIDQIKGELEESRNKDQSQRSDLSVLESRYVETKKELDEVSRECEARRCEFKELAKALKKAIKHTGESDLRDLKQQIDEVDTSIFEKKSLWERLHLWCKKLGEAKSYLW